MTVFAKYMDEVCYDTHLVIYITDSPGIDRFVLDLFSVDSPALIGLRCLSVFIQVFISG